MRSLPWLPSLPFLLLCLASCELTEVTIPEGEPRVIVQAVLSARRADQFVVVERSLTGAPSSGDNPLPGIPPSEPREPIAGATVTLTHEGPSACAGTSDTLTPQASMSGIYRTSFCPLEPGDRVRLRVVTPDGEVVTGATTIPGARAVSVRLATDSASFEDQVLELDRQRDTIRVAVEPILARALQVEIRWRSEPDSLVFLVPTDTFGLAIPADLFNPFAGDSGKPVFEVGLDYVLGIAVADSNYYDFVRSRSDPFTGRGFLNNLDGGIGVFGSVAVYTYYLRVVR